MKEKIFRKIWVLVGLLLLFSSCKNITQNNEQAEKETPVVTLNISYVNYKEIGRQVLTVSDAEELNYYKGLSYDLYAVNGDNETVSLLSDISYENLLKATPTIKAGNWTFTLNATDKTAKAVILTASITQTVSYQNYSLGFDLTVADGIEGTVNIKIIYSTLSCSTDDDGNLVHPCFNITVKDKTNTTVNSKLYTVEEGEPEEIENDFYSKLYTFTAPIDVYNLYVDSGDSEDFDYKYLGHDVVYLTPGFTYSVEHSTGFDLSSFKNEWSYVDDNGETVTGMDYATAIEFSKIIENLDTVSCGQVFNISFAGKTEKDISGIIQVIIAGFDNEGNWYNCGQIFPSVDFKADHYFSEKFEVAITDENVENYQDFDIDINYFAESLDEETVFHNVEIAADVYDAVKYTYHIGGLTDTYYSTENEAYTLITETSYKDHKVIGWYDNADLTGTPITEIAAADNTVNRDFYAKYNYVFTKWDEEEGSWSSFNIYLAEFNLEPPEANQVVTLKLTATPSESFEGSGISSSFGIHDPWTEICGDWSDYALIKDQKVTLRYDYLIPEGSDFTDKSRKTALSLAMEKEGIVLSDWDVDIEYNDISSTFENSHITAEAKDDGIHFTVKNAKTDSLTYITVALTDSDDVSGVNYRFDNYSEDEYTFVYPFVDADKNYFFKLSYHQPYALSDKTGTKYNDEEVYIKSAGGSGEIDLSACSYRDISISLTGDDEDTDEEHRYFMVNDKFDADKIKAMFDAYGCTDVMASYTVNCGKTNSCWDWVSGSEASIDYGEADTDSFYKELAENGKFDIIPLTYESNLAKIANYDNNYWATLRYSFNADDIGHFELPEIHSATATYVPIGETCTVTFVAYEGEVYKTIKIAKDSAVSAPEENPTTEGWTFAGWYCNGEEYDFTTPVTESIEIASRWTPNHYKVTFNSDGGTAVAEQTVNYNITASKPDDPVKTGYTFDYWYLDDAAKEYDFTTPVTSDLTLTAHWTLNTYKVTFNSDGGTAVAEQTVNYNGIVTRPSDPTKTGYTFAGWYLNDTTEYNFSESVTENLTLTAYWTLNTYKVTFNSDGGTAVAEQTVNYNGTVTRPSDPTKTGYTFAGWYLNDTTRYNFSESVTENLTLTAHWTEESLPVYQVSFDTNGGYQDPSDTSTWNNTVDVTSGEYVAEPSVKLVRTGYTFDYWYLNDENTAYDFKNTPVTSGIKLTAHWTIVQYTVIFMNEGEEYSSVSVDYNTKIASMPANPSKNGYTFAGWYNGDEVFSSDSTITADMTLTAHWTVNSYTLTLDYNNGTGGTYKVTAGYGSDWTYTLNSNAVTRTGYRLLGWASSADAAESEYDSTFTYENVPAADVTLYAVWQKLSTGNSITIEWDIPTTNTVSLTYDATNRTVTAEEGYDSYTWSLLTRLDEPSGEVLQEGSSNVLNLDDYEWGEDTWYYIVCESSVENVGGYITIEYISE